MFGICITIQYIACRGYLAKTGQEFVNTRQPDGGDQPFEYDTGMGILPEAIDMSGATPCY